MNSMRSQMNVLINENNGLKHELDLERQKPPREIEIVKTVEAPPQIVYKPDEQTLRSLEGANEELKNLKSHISTLEQRHSQININEQTLRESQIEITNLRTHITTLENNLRQSTLQIET